jgi:FtsH-binding integral membrane protein
MIKHMDWFFALLALIVIGLISNNHTKILTEHLYVLNTYLYVLLSIIIVATTWGVLDNNSCIYEHIFTSNWHIFGLVILTFVFLICTLLMPTENVVAKHAAWATFIVTIGVMSYITYKDSFESGNLNRVSMTLIILLGIMSWLAYSKPLDYFDSWQDPLMFVLCGLIIVELTDLSLQVWQGGDVSNFVSRFRIYSWIAIILFSGFLIYDTQQIRKNAIKYVEICSGQDQAGCVDYCNGSLGIFLDVLNLFTNLNNVYR